MSDIPEKSNGLDITVHETEPIATITIFIDGKYTSWVEFDLPQMASLIKTMQGRFKEMKKKQGKLS